MPAQLDPAVRELAKSLDAEQIEKLTAVLGPSTAAPAPANGARKTVANAVLTSVDIICYRSEVATWMSTDEAAEYLGIGKTKLYALTKEGKLPANRLGKKWTYEREALAEWLRGSRSVENFFIETPAVIEGNTNLRDPQRDAYCYRAA